jgi:hypothetical protein
LRINAGMVFFAQQDEVFVSVSLLHRQWVIAARAVGRGGHNVSNFAMGRWAIKEGGWTRQFPRAVGKCAMIARLLIEEPEVTCGDCQSPLPLGLSVNHARGHPAAFRKGYPWG